MVPTRLLLASVVLATLSLRDTANSQDVKQLPDAKSQSIIKLQRIRPTDKAFLDVGHTYLFEVETEVEPPKSGELALLATVSVNGKALPSAKLRLSPGVSAKARWAWDIRAEGTQLDVCFTVFGAIGLRKDQVLISESRRYLVAYPYHPAAFLPASVPLHYQYLSPIRAWSNCGGPKQSR
jgi:hypothetical protein